MHAWISHWHDQVAASVSHMHAPPCHACREGRGGHLGTRGIGWYGPIWQLPRQPACQLSFLVRLWPREPRGRPQVAVGTKTLSLLNVPGHDPAATSLLLFLLFTPVTVNVGPKTVLFNRF